MCQHSIFADYGGGMRVAWRSFCGKWRQRLCLLAYLSAKIRIASIFHGAFLDTRLCALRRLLCRGALCAALPIPGCQKTDSDPFCLPTRAVLCMDSGGIQSGKLLSCDASDCCYYPLSGGIIFYVSPHFVPCFMGTFDFCRVDAVYSLLYLCAFSAKLKHVCSFLRKEKRARRFTEAPGTWPFPAGAGKARTTVLARRLTGSALCVRGAVRESRGYKLSMVKRHACGFFFVLFLSAKKKNRTLSLSQREENPLLFLSKAAPFLPSQPKKHKKSYFFHNRLLTFYPFHANIMT